MTAGWRECADPSDDSDPPEVKRRTRREVTDDFVEGTRTIREWINGGGVQGPALCEELDAWLDYWGGSPATPAPPPAGDLRERIARAAWESEDDDAGSWEAAGRLNHQAYRRMADAMLAVLPTPPTPPVPPWPGAVLSGLCDEDGQPTWLAQAGQVRGEQVRPYRSKGWVIERGYAADLWVEVRAPRVPETERVNALDAIRDRIELTHPEGEFLAVGVQLIGGDLVAFELEEPWGKTQLVAPDGTVEVLKDGGR